MTVEGLGPTTEGRSVPEPCPLLLCVLLVNLGGGSHVESWRLTLSSDLILCSLPILQLCENSWLFQPVSSSVLEWAILCVRGVHEAKGKSASAAVMWCSLETST